MTRTSLLFLIFLFATIFSNVVIEEDVLRGAIYEVSFDFPKMTSLMWRFRNESYWERGLLFHVVVPKDGNYEITVSFEIYNSHNLLIYSEIATITQFLAANVETFLYVILTQEIPIKPLDFLEGAYYFIVRINIARATSGNVLGAMISWAPKPLIFQDALVLPSSYIFKISYKDASTMADFQSTEITYGIVLESRDYKNIYSVYATAALTNAYGVTVQSVLSINGNNYSMSSWDLYNVYFYPNNLKFYSSMSFELNIILSDS